MNQESGKKAAALAALDFIQDEAIIGVGSGSTVAYFVTALQKVRQRIEGVVAGSVAIANQLKALSIPLLDLNSVGDVPLYVDGADEINPAKQLIKGGGGALTREKIIASAAKKFICIADDSKCVMHLGTFPVAVEVIPLARSYVARQIVLLGGVPVYREGFVTDNGNVILDVYHLKLFEPKSLEVALKGIVGVVESGLFAKRMADVVLLGSTSGVRTLS
jgi:ribose 5-phosphate isomerase A